MRSNTWALGSVERGSSASIAGYFADLQDGIHNATSDDPRVSVITVNPHSIRYWYATQGTVGRAIDTATAAVTGKLTVPGELYTLSSDEVNLSDSSLQGR